MKNKQQEKAKSLYFQTNMTKSQIAEKVGVNRKTVLFWSKQDNWDKLKMSAHNTPSLVAEKCYHLIDQFASALLVNDTGYSSLSLKHAQTIHLLASSIKKLKNRSTVNESMEMFNFFLEGLNRRDPALAEQVAPQIEEYITIRNSASANDFLVEGFNPDGSMPFPEKELHEKWEDEMEYEELTSEFEEFLKIREARKAAKNDPPPTNAPHNTHPDPVFTNSSH